MPAGRCHRASAPGDVVAPDPAELPRLRRDLARHTSVGGVVALVNPNLHRRRAAARHRRRRAEAHHRRRRARKRRHRAARQAPARAAHLDARPRRRRAAHRHARRNPSRRSADRGRTPPPALPTSRSTSTPPAPPACRRQQKSAIAASPNGPLVRRHDRHAARRPDVQLPADVPQRRRRGRGRRDAGRRRLGADPREFSASRFWDDVADTAARVPVYRRAVPLPGQLAATSARARPQARGCAAATASAATSGRPSSSASPSRILRILRLHRGQPFALQRARKPGAIGQVPAFLAHRFPVAIVALRSGHPRAAARRRRAVHPLRPDEPGEALGKIGGSGDTHGRPFEGYANDAASAEKIARDVLAPGDAWFRTGDLMRRDRAGFSTSSTGSATRSVGREERRDRRSGVSAHGLPRRDRGRGLRRRPCRRRGPRRHGGADRRRRLRSAASATMSRRNCPTTRALFLRIEKHRRRRRPSSRRKRCWRGRGSIPIASATRSISRPRGGAFVPLDRAAHDRLVDGQLRGIGVGRARGAS